MKICVVGAGPVGGALALGLTRRGHEVTVIERAAPERSRGRLGVDVRNVALNPQSRRCLSDLGVWPEATAPYTGMQVWEEWGQGKIEFNAQDVGETELGWLVEASLIQTELWTRVAEECEVHMEPLTDLSVQADGAVKVTLADTTLVFDLVFGVDGGRSAVREFVGLELDAYSVDQSALATVIKTEAPHGGIARQRFLTDGPLALLPSLAPDVVSVVWSQSRHEAERRKALPTDAFLQEISIASEHCLGNAVEVDDRFVFPLTQQILKSPVHKNSVILLGDAARVVHPLAGLGVNLGFEDVLQIFKLSDADQLASASGWQRFARRHTLRGKQMIQLLGMFKWLYSRRDPLTTWVRNSGTRLFDAASPVKHQVMREAMGVGPLSAVD